MLQCRLITSVCPSADRTSRMRVRTRTRARVLPAPVRSSQMRGKAAALRAVRARRTWLRGLRHISTLCRTVWWPSHLSLTLISPRWHLEALTPLDLFQWTARSSRLPGRPWRLRCSRLRSGSMRRLTAGKTQSSCRPRGSGRGVTLVEEARAALLQFYSAPDHEGETNRHPVRQAASWQPPHV